MAIFVHDQVQASANSFATVAVPESRIETFFCRVNKNTFGYYINSLRLVLASGAEVTLFDQSNLGKEYEVQVMPQHVIVGVYGKTTTQGPSRICSLGFIAMDTSELV